MLNNTALTLRDLELINYNNIFREDVSLHCLNDAYNLNIIKSGTIDIRDITTRRIIMHHLIDSACKYIINNRSDSQHVFVYNQEQISVTELSEFCNQDKLFEFIRSTTHKLMKFTGIIFIESPCSYDDYRKGFLLRSGDVLDHLIESLKHHRPYNLSKLYKFVKDHGLVNLQQKIFDEYKYKLVLV